MCFLLTSFNVVVIRFCRCLKNEKMIQLPHNVSMFFTVMEIKSCWFKSPSPPTPYFLKYLNIFWPSLSLYFSFLSVCNKINYVWCTTAYPHERKSKTRDFSFKKAILSCFRCSKGINLPYRIALEDCDNWKHPYSLHVQRDLSDFVM